MDTQHSHTTHAFILIMPVRRVYHLSSENRSILFVVGDTADTINYLLFVYYLIGNRSVHKKKLEKIGLISRDLLCNAGNA